LCVCAFVRLCESQKHTKLIPDYLRGLQSVWQTYCAAESMCNIVYAARFFLLNSKHTRAGRPSAETMRNEVNISEMNRLQNAEDVRRSTAYAQ